MEEEIWNYHFAMNGKSYQVILKHFYSLLTKVSSEETKHLLALPVLLSDGCVLAGERVFLLVALMLSLHILTPPGNLPACCTFNPNSLLSASSKTSNDWGGCGAASSCAVELLHGCLPNFRLIKTINPLPVSHYHSWQWPLLSRGIRNMKYMHLAEEIFNSCHPVPKTAGAGTDFWILCRLARFSGRRNLRLSSVIAAVINHLFCTCETLTMPCCSKGCHSAHGDRWHLLQRGKGKNQQDKSDVRGNLIP